MIPKLRFSNFNDTWAGMNLGEISIITIGEFVIKTKQSDDGQYPVYNGGQTPTGHYDEYNNEGNKIVISARGASAGFVNFQYGRYWAGNSCYSVSLTKPTYSIRFFYHYLKAYQRRFTDYQQAANIPSVSKKDVQLFQVKVPCEKEQNRIAEFFDCIDKQINLLTKKKEALETYKKGLMQKIFSQENRFKRDDGTDYPEWKRVTLNDIVRSNIRYGIVQPGDFTVDGMILIRGVDYMKGWNDIGNFFRVSESIESKYRKARVKNGDLLISIVGTPGKAVIVPDYIKEANITQTTARVPLSDDQSEIFYQEQINDYRIQKDISKLIKGAAQPGINVEDVKKLKVFQPSYEEQKRLEKMFDTLIKRIISIEKQLNLTKELKKGLLQQMFV